MISIVTITYNNYKELNATLNSIPKADYIESIVINGGQCEKTIEFLKSFSGKSISEKDDGIADAFNKGINLSSGECLMFLNSGDTLLEKSYPEQALEILKTYCQYDFIHSNLLLTDGNENELFLRPQMKSLGRGMPFLHPTMVVRKKVFEKTGLFDKSFSIAMDFDWVVRLQKNKFRGFYLNENAVVKMDGRGKSVIEESKAIKECYSILKAHKFLTFKNSLGFATRYALFLGRKVLIKIGLNKQLNSMKKIKHSK